MRGGLSTLQLRVQGGGSHFPELWEAGTQLFSIAEDGVRLWRRTHTNLAPTHHTNTPHQHTTPTHHTNTPPIWCCGCRILAGTKLSQCHGDSFKLVGVVSPASELEMLLQCPPYLQQTNMPPTKTNISGGGTDIMTDITGSHASGGEFDEVLRLALGVPPLYEQVPQPPCSSCFPSVVTSTAAMVTLST